jgi:ubiquinone biosynthesis protein
VATVLVKHGLGILVAGLDLPGVRASRRFESTPARAVAAIKELGPTYIKLGQILSTRPDVIPQAYIEAFEQLQDNVEPMPFSSIAEQMALELGVDWRARIDEIDESPLATASIAQVHRARLLDGQQVVFKVQRPGIEKGIRSDLNILSFLTQRTNAEFPEAELFDLKGILSEFRRSTISELDFTAEARNLRRFQVNFEGNAAVVLPDVHEALSTRRVLCMEFLDGTKIRVARQHGHNMKVVGERYLDVAYSMLFEHGFFHGDLHPGNVLILEGERIGIIDCGMVGRLSTSMKDNIAALIFALHRGDQRTVARLFFDICFKERRIDYPSFERDTIEVAERHWSGGSISEMHIGAFLMDLTRGALRHRLQAPPEFTMFFKSILTTEGLAKAMLPEVDPIRAAQPYVRALLAERWGQERLMEDSNYTMMSLSTLARRLPITLTQLLDDVDHQRLLLRVSLRESPELLASHDRRQNRLIVTILTVAAALCGTLSLSWEGGHIGGWPLLSLAFYALALPLFLMSVLMVFRNRG